MKLGDLTIKQVRELCELQQGECGSCPIKWNCPYVIPVPRNWRVDVDLVLDKKTINKKEKEK